LVNNKIFEWAEREEEFVRRAAFALIAGLAVHNKKEKDNKFEEFYPLILKYCTDNRNFVKKAINWALRQIGKRNLVLNESAIELSKEMLKIESKSARWIATDAIRELESPQILERLKLLDERKK
jgi:3-methyladenine DNA glycosylase AlkD